MTQTTENFQTQLPSNKSLITATLFAVIVGCGVLVTAILPAEYGIDPTGIGASLGLTQLAKSTVELTEVAEDKTEQPNGVQSHGIELVIPAGTGLEYKFQIAQGEKIQYQWDANGELYLDLHGEPQGDTTGYFESYAESSAKAMKGQFITPFEGSHGWYWQNKSAVDITVNLKVGGKFEVIGIK